MTRSGVTFDYGYRRLLGDMGPGTTEIIVLDTISHEIPIGIMNYFRHRRTGYRVVLTGICTERVRIKNH